MAKSRKSSKSYAEVPAISPSHEYKPPEERTNGPFDGYEIREALSTLTKAVKIRKNAKLMRAVRAEANKQLQAAAANSKLLAD